MTDPPTTTQGRPIFRADVYERFVRARSEPVWPHLVAPRTMRVVWMLLALVLAGSVLAWCAPVPTFDDALAVELSPQLSETLGNRELAWAVLVPAESAKDLRAGQTVLVDDRTRAKGVLVEIDEQPSTPERIAERLHLSGAAARAIDAPKVIAFARRENATSADERHPGELVTARIRSGERRAISFLPVVGRWFESMP